MDLKILQNGGYFKLKLNELYKIADYKDKSGMLFNGDCLEVMKNIPDGSIDMIFTDPPYDISATNRGGVQ